MAARTVIVILGMHRGGTSLVTRAVNALGIELGVKLHPASQTENPTGFWEDEEILDINERVLAALGVSWHSLAFPEIESWTFPALQDLKKEAVALLRERLSHYSSWGFKDPRTARLLPFWKDVFLELEVEPSYVIALRDPLSVAASLERRNGFLGIRSHVLWLEHMLGALQGTVGTHRVFVDYDALVEHPVTQLRRLAKNLGIEVTEEIGARISEFANGFVSNELRHQRAAADSSLNDPRVPKPVLRLYSLVRDLATDKASGRRDARSVFQAVEDALREWRPLCDYIDSVDQFPELSKQIKQLGEMHLHALVVVEARDAQLQKLTARLDQLGEKYAHAQDVVRERDAQLAHVQAVVRERDAQLAELQSVLNERETELERIKTHWYWRIARLIIR